MNLLVTRRSLRGKVDYLVAWTNFESKREAKKFMGDRKEKVIGVFRFTYSPCSDEKLNSRNLEELKKLIDPLSICIPECDFLKEVYNHHTKKGV